MKTFEEKKFDIWRGKHLVKGRRRRKTFKTNVCTRWKRPRRQIPRYSNLATALTEHIRRFFAVRIFWKERRSPWKILSPCSCTTHLTLCSAEILTCFSSGDSLPGTGRQMRAISSCSWILLGCCFCSWRRNSFCRLTANCTISSILVSWIELLQMFLYWNCRIERVLLADNEVASA